VELNLGARRHPPAPGDLEPEWVKNPEAANVDVATVGLTAEKVLALLAELCEGETTHCEWCGAPFPIWPTPAWADHIRSAHADILTIAIRNAMDGLCMSEFTVAKQVYFGQQFIARISMRRRAWQLGVALVGPVRIVPRGVSN
jgi:hypothetical protein